MTAGTTAGGASCPDRMPRSAPRPRQEACRGRAGAVTAVPSQPATHPNMQHVAVHKRSSQEPPVLASSNLVPDLRRSTASSGPQFPGRVTLREHGCRRIGWPHVYAAPQPSNSVLSVLHNKWRAETVPLARALKHSREGGAYPYAVAGERCGDLLHPKAQHVGCHQQRRHPVVLHPHLPQPAAQSSSRHELTATQQCTPQQPAACCASNLSFVERGQVRTAHTGAGPQLLSALVGLTSTPLVATGCCCRCSASPGRMLAGWHLPAQLLLWWLSLLLPSLLSAGVPGRSQQLHRRKGNSAVSERKHTLRP